MYRLYRPAFAHAQICAGKFGIVCMCVCVCKGGLPLLTYIDMCACLEIKENYDYETREITEKIK